MAESQTSEIWRVQIAWPPVSLLTGAGRFLITSFRRAPPEPRPKCDRVHFKQKIRSTPWWIWNSATFGRSTISAGDRWICDVGIRSHARQVSRNWVGRGFFSRQLWRSTWLMWCLHGCYGVYVAVVGSTWLLQGLQPVLFRENRLAWLIRDRSTWRCDCGMRGTI